MNTCLSYIYKQYDDDGNDEAQDVDNQDGDIPIEGDLNGYFSGRSTRTFHTPPSYGARNKIVLSELYVTNNIAIVASNVFINL